MTDLLEGRHIVQLKADDPGLNRGPTDNDSDENLTEDY